MHPERQGAPGSAHRGALSSRSLFAVGLLAALVACRSPRATGREPPGGGAGATSAAVSAEARTDAGPADAAAGTPNLLDAGPAPAATREIGPFEAPFDGKRTVYWVAARSTRRPARLLANIHGVCNPPGYACGYWVEAAADAGFLVCPSGNSHCGGPNGPPTWTQSFEKIDADLEKAIAFVEARYPGEISRDGAILTGFSLGASAAYQIARSHPGRWPYLILNEANVPLQKAELEAAGVRAVALIAGEVSSQIAGERQTAARLAKQGYPARLWVMKGAAHHYSADIDAIMAEAIAFVLSEGRDAGP